jgi:hypothetical protein
MPERGVLADRTRRVGRCLSEDRGDDAMNKPTMETLARRLDRVERENRRVRFTRSTAQSLIRFSSPNHRGGILGGRSSR